MKTLKNLAEEFDLSDEQMDEALGDLTKFGLKMVEFNEPMEEYFRKKLQEFKDDS